MKVPSVGSWARRGAALAQQRNVASGVAVMLLASAVVVAAVQADGTKATNVQLDDGTVWVSNQGSQLVGRLNIKVDELDLAVSAGTAADVAQDGRDVVITGDQGGVRRMDVLTGEATGTNDVNFLDYQLNGGIATLLDPTSGRLWVGSSATVVGAEYPKNADAQLESGSRVIVTAGDRDAGGRGRVFVVGPDGYFELELDDQLKPIRENSEIVPDETASDASVATAGTEGTLPEDQPDAIAPPEVKPLAKSIGENTSIAAVGDRLVFLDADGSVFSTRGDVAMVPGDGPVLQQTGPEDGAVLVATSAGLFEVPIGSSTVRELTTADGAPAQPVRVGPCVFGAWSGATPTWFKACNGKVLVPVTPIPKAVAQAQLVYRVNQRNVAINSVGDGGVWADHDGTLAQIGNWEDAQSQEVQAEDAQAGQTTREAEQQCIEGSDAPIATKDELGARPRQSILDVLYNDDDVNCEPIAIIPSSVSPTSGEWGDLTVVDNGQHLLFSPSTALIEGAKSARQTVSFVYAVEDTSGHQSEPVDVTLAVYAEGNSPPALRPKSDGTTRQMRTSVEEGKSVTYDVLGDWWDPDGDDILLANAVPEAGEVTSTPDGIVRFGAYGLASAGPTNIAVTMTDGVASTTEQFEVTVKPSGSPIAPAASDDFITLVEGATGTLLPLANDSDPNEDTLSLVPLWANDAAEYRVTTVQGDALQITGVVAGTYALRYEASDGVDKSAATIRLVVLAPGETNHAPVAVPDRVKLRVDRVVNVDVLANDIDADGDVLAVTAVQAPGDTPDGRIRATIIDRRMVQVEVNPGTDGAIPTGPFFIGYTLSDGHAQDRAATQDAAANGADLHRTQGVIYVSIVPPSIDQAPVAGSDEMWVRTGDVGSAPVLVNDIDPDGDSLALAGVFPDQAKQLETDGSLVAWTQGRNLFVKGGTPSSYDLQYTVSANGKDSAGSIRIHVTPLPEDPGNPNSAPTPKGLVLRAVRNTTVRLQVPTAGVDRDGDSVTLVETFGDLQGAAQGNAVTVDPNDPNVMLFTAGLDAAAADSFTYSLRDTYGAVGTATVTVVVLDNEGWAPQAHDDIRVAKPGRVLTVPLLANDTSPQDNPLQLADNPFFDLDGRETDTPQHPDSVKVLDQTKPTLHGRVEVTVPTDGSTLSEHYRITDGKNPSDAYLRVTPDPNAPNLPPVAVTDVVKSTEIAGKESVVVDVLANDFDPDDVLPLTLELPTGQAGTIVDGKVTIPLDIVAQTVLYRIKDEEGGSTIGIIRVPGKENHPPELSPVGKDTTARSIAADATEPLTILLADIVQDPDNDPRIVFTDTEISVVGGLGSVSRSDDGSGFTYTPPGTADKPAQVTIQFEVTDRPDFTPAQRQEPLCNCLASLPVVVNVTASSPPRVVSSGKVEVPQYAEEVVYDLAPLMVDDQGDPLTFDVVDKNAGGLDITQDGSRLTIVSRKKGESKIPVGTQIPITFTATDSNFDPVQNTLMVTVISTHRGQPAAATFPEQNAERDSSFRLPNLLTPAINPFPDDPLTLLNPVVDGGATVSCTPTGDCQFTSTTVGTFHVTYTIKDAVDQTASGTIVVVVKGKPRAPGVPRVESVGDHVVNLSWSAADMQGGTFKTYWVTAVESGVRQQFSATGGQFTGLTNATTYHFVVEAENELGLGESSLQSSPAVPDRVPDPPVSPVFTDYGDGKLFLSWSPPATAGDFSAIKQYQVSIGGQTLTTTGATNLTVTALQNGTDYTYQVRAQNSATTNGGWGEWTTSVGTERPSRFPDPPTNVKAVNSGDGGTPRLTVTWNSPLFDGGRPISSYKVCVAATTNCQTITTGLQATFTANRSQTVSFTVVALNSDKHKNDSTPATSPATVAVGNPDTPVISSITSGDKTLVVQATSTNGSGCSSFFLEYSRDTGASWQTSNTFAGLVNGTTYTVVVRAKLPPTCGTTGTTYQSATSAPSTQTPYGPLVQPTMIGSRAGNVINWSWSANRADDGRPGWTASLTGECAGGALPNGSLSRDFGYNSGFRSCTITISAPGVASLAASWGDSTPAPPPAISTSKGGGGAGCGGFNCVVVSGTNFRPNAPLSVYCQDTATTYVGPYSLGSTDGAGNFGARQSVCWHATGAINNQNIRVTDGVLTAEQVSAW